MQVNQNCLVSQVPQHFMTQRRPSQHRSQKAPAQQIQSLLWALIPTPTTSSRHWIGKVLSHYEMLWQNHVHFSQCNHILFKILSEVGESTSHFVTRLNLKHSPTSWFITAPSPTDCKVTSSALRLPMICLYLYLKMWAALRMLQTVKEEDPWMTKTTLVISQKESPTLILLQVGSHCHETPVNHCLMQISR